MSLGERLKELREEKNLTQNELGQILGVSGRQISNYESNKQIFRDEESFLKIIRLFDVSADYLFGLTEDKNYGELFYDLKRYKDLSPTLRNEFKNYINYLYEKQKNKTHNKNNE